MRTESYTNLYHGTSDYYIHNILSDGFKPSKKGWCGKGVYFYNIKGKAWWSANRTCNMIKNDTGIKTKPCIIIVDVNDVSQKDILDFRDVKECIIFEKYILENFPDFNIDNDNFDMRIRLQSALIDFYTKENNIVLVIGNFEQNNKATQIKPTFINKLTIVPYIETIFCVKNTDCIKINSYITKGGKVHDI